MCRQDRSAHLRSDLRNERGAMLIVALMVLTLLAILGSAFVTLMSMESKATQNFKNSRAAEVVANSAESSVVAMLRSGMFWDGYTAPDRKRSSWIFGIKSPKGEISFKQALEDTPPEQASLAGTVEESLSRVERYKTKVVDTSAQIYINGEQSNLPTLLDRLASALEKDVDVGVNPFLVGSNRLTGEDIIRYRKKLGGVFTSKAQLRPLLGEKNYRIIADYVTAHSWIDDQTYRGSDGQSEITAVLRPDLISGVSRGGGLRTEITGTPGATPEPRAPVNVNTAPRPVLVALLTGLGGRRPFPFVKVQTQQIDEGSRGLIDTTGTFPPEREETLLQQTPIWIYTKPLTIDQATKIANEIIGARKGNPFKVWRSSGGRDSTTGFENFIDKLDEGLFPAPDTVQVRHPDPKVTVGPLSGFLRDQSSPSGRMWSRGHDSIERAERQAKKLPYSPAFAFYYDTMRSVLKANFNPNSRINKFNPNSVVYMPVDKLNLIKLDEEDDRTPRPGHTTEFCFEPNGVFEVQTVAEINRIEEDGTSDLVSETKKRTIVKVWETLRHTSQFDFEVPFNSGEFNSFTSREYVTSYPDPMDALHRDYYEGSLVDGRIELSGYADAILSKAENDSQRLSSYEARQNILMGTGYRYRNEKDTRDLGQALRSSRGTDRQKLLDQMLDPEFTRDSQMGQRYSGWNWKLAENQLEDPSQLKYSKVTTAMGGSDLFPDGFHSGIFRNRPNGARFMYYPASKYRQVPSNEGAIGGQQRNDIGSLAYYNGGVSFWVKFDFDPRDPVFSGLLGATQVQTVTAPQPLTSSEGSQIYVYKNTDGQLRITRLYYHQAFLEGQTAAVPAINEEASAEGGEEIIPDPRKFYARTDVLISLAGNQGIRWRAKEWHHVVVAWNDETGGRPIAVWLDGEESSVVPYSLGEGEFVALNERVPKDGIFVGSFFRDQAVANEGLFKFGTNLTYEDGIAVERAQSVKRVLANATIDEFVTFQGAYTPRFGSPTGYFTDKTGKYANRFEIPFPDGIDRIRLRSFTWTEYVPNLHSGLGVDWQDSNLRMSVVNAGGNGTRKSLRDPGGDSSQSAGFAGAWISPTGANIEGRTGELIYEYEMSGARGLAADGGKTVASPALDDVTLTYYLPTVEFLLTETLD